MVVFTSIWFIFMLPLKEMVLCFAGTNSHMDSQTRELTCPEPNVTLSEIHMQ